MAARPTTILFTTFLDCHLIARLLLVVTYRATILGHHVFAKFVFHSVMTLAQLFGFSNSSGSVLAVMCIRMQPVCFDYIDAVLVPLTEPDFERTVKARSDYLTVTATRKKSNII